MSEGITIREERITPEEYISFLKRTDLGSQYPKERFEKRIAKLVKTVTISLVARNENDLIVGALFGLTDYAYWLYVTDLGVDRDYERQGIGRQLMKINLFDRCAENFFFPLYHKIIFVIFFQLFLRNLGKYRCNRFMVSFFLPCQI